MATEAENRGDAAPGQGTPRTAGNPQKLGRGEQGCFSGAFGRSTGPPAPDTFTPDLWPPELRGDEVLLFRATPFVTNWYDSPWKLNQTIDLTSLLSEHRK